MNLIILGAPGSGKGTQAKLIAEKFGLKHISSGELLRQEAESGSEKGRLVADLLKTGELLPFETVLDCLEPALVNAKDGFIIDGTPRDLKQAEYLEWFLDQRSLKVDKVIYLAVPKEESLKRLLKRSEIEHRSDDSQDTILNRLEVYQKETKPVIDYYRQKGILIEIDGTPDIQTIFDDIVNHLILA